MAEKWKFLLNNWHKCEMIQMILQISQVWRCVMIQTRQNLWLNLINASNKELQTHQMSEQQRNNHHTWNTLVEWRPGRITLNLPRISLMQTLWCESNRVMEHLVYPLSVMKKEATASVHHPIWKQNISLESTLLAFTKALNEVQDSLTLSWVTIIQKP